MSCLAIPAITSSTDVCGAGSSPWPGRTPIAVASGVAFVLCGVVVALSDDGVLALFGTILALALVPVLAIGRAGKNLSL